MAGDCLYFARAYYFIWSVMRWITAPEPGTAAAGGWRGVGVLGVPGVLGAGSGTCLAPRGVRSRENEGAGV